MKKFIIVLFFLPITLGMNFQINAQNKKWTLQEIISSDKDLEHMHSQESRIQVNNKGYITLNNLKIPIHLIEWYQQQSKITEEEAITLAWDRLQIIQDLRQSMKIEPYVGARIKQSAMCKIEDTIQQNIWEAVIMPELRSPTILI